MGQPAHVPTLGQIGDLVRLRRQGGAARGVDRAATVADVRRMASRRVPRSVFDFVDGGADDEVARARNLRAFAEVEFIPDALVDVSTVDVTAPLLSKQTGLPLVLAPTGFTGFVNSGGESAVARAAAEAGVPYCVSTMTSTAIEEIADAARGARLWYQLYPVPDHTESRAMVARAQASGCEALVVTIDTATVGRRLRDRRNSLTLPPALTAKSVVRMAPYPRWWWGVLTHLPLEFGMFPGKAHADVGRSTANPALTPELLSSIRSQWDGPLFVKGVVSQEAARRVVGLGADGVIVSNHGGRQLDRLPGTLDALEPIVDAVGSATRVYLDGGVRSGADIVAAVALGAEGVFAGRPYLYGLMAGGERGVSRVLSILAEEAERTLRLLGVPAMTGVTGRHAMTRGRAAARGDASRRSREAPFAAAGLGSQ